MYRMACLPPAKPQESTNVSPLLTMIKMISQLHPIVFRALLAFKNTDVDM